MDIVEKEYEIGGGHETAMGLYSQRTPTQTSIQDVERVLGSIPEVPIESAGKVSELPGFVHLNPELLVAGIIFNEVTKGKDLEDVPEKSRNTTIRKILYRIFPEVKGNQKQYAALKADFIRYVRMMELYL